MAYSNPNDYKKYCARNKERIILRRKKYYKENNVRIRELNLCRYYQIERENNNRKIELKKWEEWEDDILYKFYGKKYTFLIKKKYLCNRTLHSIFHRAKLLGLKTNVRPPRVDLIKRNKSQKGITWEKRFGLDEAYKRKIEHSRKHSGKKCIFYFNGLSKIPYPSNWGATINIEIRYRDRYCNICKLSNEECKEKTGSFLDVHHIDRDKNNLDNYNLICLCRSCHAKIQLIQNDLKDYFYVKIQGLID